VKLEIHPAAALFPIMPEYEIKEMAKSITAFGLREKIGVITDAENVDTLLVIDGRNRLEALRKIGVQEDVIVKEFTTMVNLEALRCSVEEYVLMANIERRNLTQTQRRSLAGKLAVMFEEQQKDKPKEEREDSLSKAAQAAGVSRRTVATAKRTVLRDAGKAPTPSLKKGAEKKEPHVPARTVINSLNNHVQAAQKFAVKWPAESLQTVAELAKQLEQEVRIASVKQAEEAMAKAETAAKEAAAVAASVAHGEEEATWTTRPKLPRLHRASGSTVRQVLPGALFLCAGRRCRASADRSRNDRR